ncbi:phage holin family protein [Saccharothrix deserti]|uniref:phage holin family protein n=1 Tax=Saccharothrix deserti TaxID=2593674 RepID=UPI00131C97BF|nr:phage holin family protein [Saccharothrix deserti]
MTSARENTNGSGLPPVPSIPLTAESAAKIAEETSIGGLVRDATAHLSTLVRAEVELAKSEVAGEIKKGVKGSVYFIVALTVLLFSTFFAFMALGFFFSDVFGWAVSFSFLITFLLMLATAGFFAFLGYRKVKKLRAPQRTIDSARDTVAALTHRGEGR